MKISKASIAMLKRMSDKDRILANAVLKEEVHDKISITADSFVCASMLVLMEEFGFGKTRIERFIKALQEQIDTSAEFYDDAITEGLIAKLANKGICYDRR